MLDVDSSDPACLNCGAPLTGEYCAACGQRAVDLGASTWHLVREAVVEASDMDGRALRTLRALLKPGFLTTEYLRGARGAYVGPLKVFLVAASILSTVWVMTRRIDATFYGLATDTSAAGYIAGVVRSLVAASVVLAVANWVLSAGRRRVWDEVVFALHVVSAMAGMIAVVVLLSTGLKLMWGTASHAPSFLYLLFLPAAAAAELYLTIALHRVYKGAWLAAIFRAVVVSAFGLATFYGALLVAA